MLTKIELLPNGIPHLGNHPKESRDSTYTWSQKPQPKDFHPEVSNPNYIPNDLGLVTKTQDFPYNQINE